MRFYLILVLVLSYAIKAYPNSVIDSLKEKLETVTEKEKVNVLSDLCWNLKYTDGHEALKYCNEGLVLAKRIKFKKGIATCLLNMGIITCIQNEFSSSISYCNQAIQQYKELDDTRGMGKAMDVLGIGAQLKGDYDLSISHFKKSQIIFESLSDTLNYLKNQGNQANVFYVKGEYKEAIKIYNRVIEGFKKIGDLDNYTRFNSNAARVYSRLGKYPQALTLFYQANRVIDSLGQPYEKANNLNNIGIIYSNLEMIPEAIATYNEALKLYPASKSLKRKADIYNNITSCYLKLKDYDKAEDSNEILFSVYENSELRLVGLPFINKAVIEIHRNNLDQAIVHLNQAFLIDSIADNSENIAAGHYNFGQIYYRQKKLELAIEHLTKALEIRETTGELIKLKESAGLLATIYEETNKYKEAIHFRNLESQANDSIFNGDKRSEIMRVLVRQKLREIGILPEEPKAVSSSNYKIYVLSGFLVLGIFWIGYRFQNETSTSKHKDVDSINSEGRISQKDAAFLSEIDKAIQENLENSSFNVNMLTKLMGVNRSLLNKRLKDLAGVPPSKYIQNQRMKEAKNLLVNSDMNISEIAYKIGIEANYFTRLFKQLFGISPKEYRSKPK